MQEDVLAEEPVPAQTAPSDDQGGLKLAAEHGEAQEKEVEEKAVNTDKENQVPELQLQSSEQDGEKTEGKRKRKGDSKAKRSSNRQISQL